MSKIYFNILDFLSAKKNNRKISMVTAYDYTCATIVNNSSVNCILVGDSAALLMSGHQDTTSATIDLMVSCTAAVSRGAPSKFIVADMPFLSYRKGINHAVECAGQLIQAGAHSVKIESVYGHEKVITHLIQSGIPVMGHIGVTPQFVNNLGGFKVQGKSQDQQRDLINQAKILQELGCFALVLECMPKHLAAEITGIINIPTIGIGSGSQTDGQVLVWHDLLGLTDYTNFNKPKFVKEYCNARTLFTDALEQFHNEITDNLYPGEEHSYK